GAAPADVSATTSARARAESVRGLPCRAILLNRRGDGASRKRERTRRCSDSPPCLLMRGNGEILAGGKGKGKGEGRATQVRTRASRDFNSEVALRAYDLASALPLSLPPSTSYSPAMSHLRTTSLMRFATLLLTLRKYSSAFFWSNLG